MTGAGANVTLRDWLIGAWTLCSYVATPVDGSSAYHPLGEDAQGLILYTPDGYVAAQLMRRDRPAFASGDPARGTPDECRAAAAFIGYAGPFTVDEATGVLNHEVAVSFFPNWLGRTQVRRADLDAGVLRLTPDVPIRSDGRDVVTRLEWRRATG